MEPAQMHHGVQDQWLLMQGTEVQNKCARKEVAEKMAEHAFHVINVTLFGSRGTSSANRFHQVLPKCQVDVLRGSAKIQTWDRVSNSSENRDE